MPRQQSQASSQYLAVIGCAFRFPGASTRDDLWRALINGRNLVTTVEPERWAKDALLHPRKSEPGASYTFAAGSLGEVSGFDAEFFGISPREAMQMDPQQRILLELAWEACEDAGIPPSRLHGTRCGVFVGVSATDYAYRRADDLGSIDATTMTGNTASIAANRLSYVFGLHGPSMVIDTACSSSLVAFHQACRSVLSGESSTALAGGIGLHLHPFGFVGFSKASMLSPRGLCTPFDAQGDGYVRSEGGALILLKRLDDAIADSDRVLGVVVASAVNTDGRKNGLTVPSHQAQAALLREAYSRCGIAPDEIDYLEAHGTGTAVGDPIETRALGEALGQHRAAGRPLLIGSVKSNLGHLEVASGMAGLMKALLCLEHRQIPPTIQVQTPNPNIDFEGWNLRLATGQTSLDPARRLIVGVNSFGFGGANAHVVLASPDRTHTALGAPAADADATPAFSPPILLSARSPAALQAVAGAMAGHLGAHPELDLYDVAAAAAFRREALSHRLAVLPGGREAMAAALEAFAVGGDAAGVVTGPRLSNAVGPVFVFTGNGSQWVGMGHALLLSDAAFRAAVEEVDALFVPLAGFSLVAEISGRADAERLAATEVAQPLLFAIQVGLTRMLGNRGITQTAVIGHSVGEVAAAWACGALTLAQAVAVIHQRSAHQGMTRGRGQMTAIGVSEKQAHALISELGLADSLCVAGINSDRAVTVAGTTDALATLEVTLTARSLWYRRLALDYPFHSPAMDGIRADLVASLAGLVPAPGAVPFYSTVSGSQVAGTTLGADYWWHNVRQPVQFAQAFAALLRDGFTTFVEIGPSPVLRGYLNDGLTVAGVDGLVIPTLSRDAADVAQVERAFYQILLAGVPYGWERLFPRPARFVDLPSYPWQRERYWLADTPEGYGLIHRRREHPLLGYRLKEDPYHWENHLDTTLYPNLADHAVGDAVVFPAAGYIDMALAAAELWHPDRPCTIDGVDILTPLLLEATSSRTVRLWIDVRDGTFHIRSRPRQTDDPWTLHVVGRIAESSADHAGPRAIEVPPSQPDADASLHYLRTTAVGLDYGPSFQAVQSVWLSGDEAIATLVTPGPVLAEVADARLHPSYLDGAFQLLADLLAGRAEGAQASAFIPVRCERVRLLRPGIEARLVRANLRRAGRRSVLADFTLHDAAGEAVAVVDKARFRAVVLRRRAVDQVRHIAMTAVPRPHPSDTGTSVATAAADLADIAARRLHAGLRITARRRYLDEVEPLLDALSSAFARKALRSTDPHPTWIDPARLLASGAVVQDAAQLLHYLLRIMADDDMLEPVEGRWLWHAETDVPDPLDIWISLMADFPDQAGLIGLVGRAGLRLPDILTGRMAPTEILAMDADRAATGPFGTEVGLARHLATAVGDLVGHLAQGMPRGRRPRVLELAAPAAGAACIGAYLDANTCDLVVAALTAERKAELAATLRDNPAARACLIDSTGSGSGDINGGQFDLVILGGGLAVEDPAKMLGVIRPLMAENGTLLTIEIYPTRAYDISFGLHPAWWSSAGASRPVGRLRTPLALQSLLARHGFEDTAVTADIPGAVGGHYLIFARTDGKPNPATVPISINGADDVADGKRVPGPWCLIVNASPYAAALGAALTDRLIGRGQRVVLVGPGCHSGSGATAVELPIEDPAAWEQFLRELALREGAPCGIVHLAGLAPGHAPAGAADCLRHQELRSAALLAALQGAASAGQYPTFQIITAQAGLAVLPEAVRRAIGPGRCVQDAPLWALARVAMNELPDQRVRWIDLAEAMSPRHAADLLVRELLDPDAEDEVILVARGRYAPRARVLAPRHWCPARNLQVPRRVYLDFSSPGPLKHLSWQNGDLPPPGPGEVEISVRAVGLNFRDVMYAMGLLPDEALESGFSGQTLGMELSGVVTAVGSGVSEPCVGEEVIAFASAAFANRVITRASAVVTKPREWSFAAAATIPTTFFTAYYALVDLARLREGERVLIHGAAGGVGIAAIQLARDLGAEVFATAGTAEKRDLVTMLGADHVFDSRSLAFADEILALTDGVGVDVVLNSLSGEAINRNLHVLRPFGRFLELGKRDFYENTHIGLRPFRNNIAYFGIDADQLMCERPALARRIFLELMSLFASKRLTPLPYRAFDATEVIDAFRFMQHSRQIGKVVVTIPEGFAATPIPDCPPLRLAPDASYLVTGGLSGFGLRTAQWLAERGARSLVLIGRRGEAGADTDTATVLAGLRAGGVAVMAPACDVTDRAALAEVLAKVAAELPPLRGVIHAAMVIDDGLLRNLSPDQLHRVLAPKTLGALHLDGLTGDLPLDFFVLYSSATTLFGNPGQGNYVAANMTLEALAADRRARGLPATCVGWGPIGDTGYLARNTEIQDALVSRMGGHPLESGDALGLLEQILVAGGSNLAVLDLAWGVMGRFLPSARSPKFSELAVLAGDTATGADDAEDLRQRLDGLDIKDLHLAVTDILLRELGEILRLSPDKIEVGRSVYDMGMDSLMGAELITALQAKLGVTLSVMALSEGPTVARLTERIVHELRPGALGDEASHKATDHARQVRQVAAQHGSDMDPALITILSEGPTGIDLSVPDAGGRP